ncbi:hypothetical protein NNRS527_02944 [Nitrosospira sp. NRS527]|nr:hypothetical protein NNRS527_02944 [Nitrosospira sp. NRS527]
MNNEPAINDSRLFVGYSYSDLRNGASNRIMG